MHIVRVEPASPSGADDSESTGAGERSHFVRRCIRQVRTVFLNCRARAGWPFGLWNQTMDARSVPAW